MSHRPFKARLYPLFARVGHALASDRRLELLDLLAQSPRHVEALAAETEMSVASVSQHLQVLRTAHLVETEREGTKVRYRLAGDDVLQLWLSLRSVAERRIVAYCRGTYCLFADEAVALLRREGFDAVRLDGGWPEWRAEGRPSE